LHYRDYHAEQAREVAGQLTDPSAKSAVLALADSYNVHPERVWCERDTPIRTVLGLPWLADDAEVALEIVAPDGQLLIGQTFRGAASGHGALEATTRIRLNPGGSRIRTLRPP
jgi:hypothetical protein